MKRLNLLVIMSALVFAGCGGGGSNVSTTPTSVTQTPTSVQPVIQGFSQEQLATAKLPQKAQPRIAQAGKVLVDPVIAGYRGNFTIMVDANGYVSTINKLTLEIINYGAVSNLKFADIWVSFDTTGPESQIYRLYQAAFNRKPDIAGLGYWINEYKNGSALHEIAGGFMASDEFKTLNGASPTNEAIITSFYSNVLHRAPDSGGFDYWLKALNSGFDRKNLLASFSESNENKAAVLATVNAGFDYVPYGKMLTTIPVQASSYLNAKNINIGPQTMPKGVGFLPNEAITAGYQFGDFFQDGTIAMVASSNVFAGQNGYGSTVAGRIYFFHTDGHGGWIDQTTNLIADRTGCISPRKIIVADFNGDGKPDVFVACHGIDGNIPAGFQQGEHPRYLLSQKDGTYKNVDAGFTCYCHSAAAADFSGRGFADIIVADPVILKTPTFLVNNKNGTFSIDTNRLAADVDAYSFPNQTTTFGKAIWTIELIDINSDGAPDLILAGDDFGGSGTWQTKIYPNSGVNTFKNIPTVLPSDPLYTLTLDIIFKDGKFSLYRFKNDYTKTAIQNISLTSLTVLSTTPNTKLDTVWISIYNGNIVSTLSNNPISVPF